MPDSILTLKQVKDFLQVSDSWLYRKVRAGIIPHFKVGGLTRFSQRDITDWLNSHRVNGCQKIS